MRVEMKKSEFKSGMKYRWKRLLACGLALSLCLQTPAFVMAAEELPQIQAAESSVTETVVTEDTFIEEVFFADDIEYEYTEENAVEAAVADSEAAAATAKQKTAIAAEKADEDGRSYTLTLSGYSGDAKKISFAVWNEKDNYTIWHDAVYDEDHAVYTAEVDMTKYDGSGTYITHCYGEMKDGTKVFVQSHHFEAEVSANVKPMIIKEGFTDDSKTEYQIVYSNLVLQKGEVVRAAVWSDKDGQDDLKWINFKSGSDNTATLTISVNDFASAGTFHVHIYKTTAEGANTFMTSRSFEVPKVVSKRVEVTVQKNGDGTTTVRIKNLTAPSGITKVRIPIWSADNQNDIYWYTASKDGSDWVAKMDIKNHKNNWKLYQIHVYATDGTGKESFAGSTTVSYVFETKVPNAVIDKENGLVRISVQDLQFPEKMEMVRAAVWSEADGQDDISWNVMSSDGEDNWKVEVPLNKLRSAGACIYHIYAAKADGTQIYVGGGRFTLEAPSVGEASVEANNKNGDFTITVEDVSDEAAIVEAVVWCAADKSDQCTYALKANDTTYSISSNIKEHKYHLGEYQVQIFVTDFTGMKIAVDRLSMTFRNKFDGIEVTNDTTETKYYLTIKGLEVPAKAESVEIAVWSDANGQDDVRWYKAEAQGSDYKATVDITNHKTPGKYSAHVYAATSAGGKTYVTATSFNVAATAPSCNVAVRNETNTGTFDVVLSNVTAPSGVSSVKVAVWPSADSSCVKWYEAAKQSDGTYKITVNAANHKYYCGAYEMHVYTVMGNGIQSFTTSKTHKYEPQNFLYVLNDQGKGKRTIAIYNPTVKNNVRFAVWSDAKGQDDCHWYTASLTENGVYKAVITYREFIDSGLFHIHAYGDSTALQASSFDFPKSEFAKNGWYYEVHNGRTYKLYYVDDVLQRDVRDIIGKQPSYKAEVNRTTCTVTIYAKDGDNGYILPVCAFACSVGLPETPTPTGTFNTLAKYRWHELMGPSWGQYCTRIVGGILFHSVAGSNATPYNLSAAAFNKLGQPASHGCVRLCVRDAKWIYDNCSLGMTVRIYDSSYPGPLGKPATIKIPSWQNWDPTDPAVQ